MFVKCKSIIDMKLLKFIIVGVVNTIVGMAIMFGLYNLAGVSFIISTASNYILTSILSYYLNKYFTFRDNKKSWKQIFRFTINIAVCYVLAYGLAKPLVSLCLSGQTKSRQENIAMFAGMCLFTGFNYIGQRFYAFRKDE